MQRGEPAAGPAARELAEQHRRYLCRWFYDCGYPMHRGLAELYVCDARIARTYEEVAPGLARYVRDAIVANADAQTG